MLNAAVVGLGWWGKQIVTCLADSEKINVVRAVDVNLEGARDFAAAHGVELGASYDDALADPAIDSVILVTPHLLHEEQVLAAAAAGKFSRWGEPKNLLPQRQPPMQQRRRPEKRGFFQGEGGGFDA